MGGRNSVVLGCSLQVGLGTAAAEASSDLLQQRAPQRSAAGVRLRAGSARSRLFLHGAADKEGQTRTRHG